MMKSLSRRAFATQSLGGLAALAFGAKQSFARPPFLQADGTPVAGEPVSYTTRRPLQHGEPKGDQTFRVTGPVVGPPTLDPALVRDLTSAFLARMVFRGLVVFDAQLNPALELAERVDVSADGLIYTFAIDPRAVFVDGRQVTADDVVFSLTRVVNPLTANGQAGLLSGPTFLSSISGFTEIMSGDAESLSGLSALDDRTVQITLAQPDAAFLMKLAAAATSIVDPSDVASGEDWWKSPNGTGPFQISEWVENDHMTLKPVESFLDGKPALEEITILLGPNAYSSFNLYQSDRVEVCSISSSDVDRVTAPESTMGDELVTSKLFASEYMTFRTDVPPLDDINVRRALTLAFPHDKVADVMFDGHVDIADGVVPDGMLGAQWPVKALPYDPDLAVATFKQSRYADAAEIPDIQIYSTGNGCVPALRDTVAEVLGLTIEAITVQSEEFFDGLALRHYPGYALYWGADFPDPATFLESLFATGSSDNYVGYSNPKFDELLQQAAREQDPTARAAIYNQAQQVLIDDAVIIPTYHDVGYYLRKPYVKGFEYTPLGLLQLETIWLER
jgi:ABC-type oligopeptide transport system substrate-binding subunit